MQNQPLVSIIIINYNGKTHLETCLKSLMEITYTNFEIILVDNNSQDGSVEFVKRNYPHIKIIELDRNYGFAEPNNIGAKQAIGEYLLFLNNDTKVTSNFLTELLKATEHGPEVAIFQSLLLKSNGDVDSSGDFIDTYGRPYNSKNRPTVIKYILSARGASMMVRKEVFWDMGGFDKNYFVMFEDIDFGWRAWIYGYKVVLVPESIVHHFVGQTRKQIGSAVIDFHNEKNSLSLRLTNFEITCLITIFSILSFDAARRFFRISLVKGSREPSQGFSLKLTIRGVLWVLKNYKYILKKRREVNSRRVKSTRDLIEMGLITKCTLR